MRKATADDADLLLRLYEMRRDPELRRARAWVLSNPPVDWDQLKDKYLTHAEEDRFIRMVTSYWQMVGSIVNRGLIDPGLFFDHTGEDIVTWNKCKAWVEGARRDIRRNYHMEFEQMVKAHQAYRERSLAALERATARSAGGAARPRARRSR